MDSRVAVTVIPSAAAETDSVATCSSSINFKKMMEQNPHQKAIAEKIYRVLIPDFKNKVAAVVTKIDYLLFTLRLYIIWNCDLKELGLETVAGSHGNDWLKLVPDDLVSGPLKRTMDLLGLQQDRISNWRRSIERRRRVCNVIIMIAVIIMLAVSAGLSVFREGLAAGVFHALGMAIKAVETCLNVMLSEEERRLEGDEEVVEMMRYGEWLMVHEFNNVRQQAKTLEEGIMAEHSKLAGHIQRMEKPEMVIKSITKLECSLKALRRIIKGYGDDIQQFSLEFSKTVRN